MKDWCELSSAIDIATGYFEIGALLTLEEKWQAVDRIRILMGDEVSLRTKRVFAQSLKKINERLDSSLESEKSQNDFLKGVPAIVEGIRSGKIQCRVFRKDKFHAKTYLTHGRAAVISAKVNASESANTLTASFTRQSKIRHTPQRRISLYIASGARSAPLGQVTAPQSR